MPLKDLTGMSFGMLTVLKRHPVNTSASKARWIVRCSCGVHKVVVGSSLISGLVVSCGTGHYIASLKFVELTGQKFGDLVVVSLYKRGVGANNSLWLVQCKCGNQETYSGKTLKKGKRVSCSRCSYGSKLKDETGNKHGNWTVISYAKRTGRGNALWACVCECGRTGIVDGGNLRSGASSQCRVCGDNSVNRPKTHGLSNTPEYRTWLVRKRMELKKILDSSWTLEMDLQLRKFFSSCVLCDAPKPLDVDHMLPLDLGYGLFTDNALILCNSCNSKKRATYITDLPPETRRKLIDASCEFQDYLEWRMYAEPVNV